MRHMLFKQRQKPSQPVRSKELANFFKASLQPKKDQAMHLIARPHHMHPVLAH